MTKAEKTAKLRKLAQQYKYDFLDPRFSTLDTSGQAGFSKPQAEESFIDERFNPLALQNQVPLADAIAQLAEHDAEMRTILANAGVKDLDQPGTFLSGDWHGGFRLNGDHWEFQVSNDESGESKWLSIYKYLDNVDAAKVEVARLLRNGVRQLNEHEKLHVARIAATNAGDAIACYLNYCYPNIGDEDATWNILVDPKHAKKLDEAVRYVFTLSMKGWSAADADNAWRSMNSYIGDRLINIGLLQEAFKAYQEQKSSRLLPENYEATAPKAHDFDSMTDEEVSQSLDSATREYIRAIRGQRQ